MFDPIPSWHEQLPADQALARLESEGDRLGLWPDISNAERIGLGWALLVSDREEDVWSRARDVPGFRWSAVGLLSPEVDGDLGTDEPPFGIILYAEDDQTEGVGRRESMAFDEIQLPVVVRPGTYEEHRGAQPMPHGRLACWATSRSRARSGWLTARHVADHPAMSGVGRVVDRAPECLDAALVDIGAVGGGLPQSLAMPCANATVDIDLRHLSRAVILDVATNLGVRNSSRFPLRFTFNAAGVPGDSGSLIVGRPCGEPMGLYLGAFTSAETVKRSGVGLALTQLSYHMNLEVYS
jgi:hypothetical protein